MMRKSVAIRLVLTVLSVPALAAVALAALPAGARAVLDNAIADAVENARSGIEVSWSSGPGYGGRIVVDKAFSQATGQVCTDTCNDPCRVVNYQVSTADALTEFRGVRCRKVDDDGSVHWTIRGTDMVVRNMNLVKQLDGGTSTDNASDAAEPPQHVATRSPTPPATELQPSTPRVAAAGIHRSLKDRKRLATQIQQSLKRLLYYSGPIDGDFGNASQSALQAFLGDERSPLEPAPTEDVLNLLNAAEQRIGRGNCPHPDGVKASDTVACATISG